MSANIKNRNIRKYPEEEYNIMKKLTKVVFLLLVVAMVIASCKPETPTIPEVPTVEPTVVPTVESTVVPIEIPTVIPIEEAKEEPIEEPEDVYSCLRDPYGDFILDLGEFGSYEPGCYGGDMHYDQDRNFISHTGGNLLFFFYNDSRIRKGTSFSRQPSKKGDTLSFTTPDVATKISLREEFLLVKENGEFIYNDKAIKFLINGEEWNAVLGDSYLLSSEDKNTSVPPNSKVEIQALEDLTVPLLKLISSVRMERAEIEDLLSIEMAEEKRIARETKAREEYYKSAIEIPVSITTDNPLVSATCAPELEYLERTWYSIGVDGEYGVFKPYCEQAIFPKLSLNVQVLSTETEEDSYREPSKWKYNLNQPNVVKAWTTPLYSIFFEEDQDVIYSINLGKAYRNAYIYQKASNLYFKDHDNPLSDRMEIIQEDEEMIMIINGEWYVDGSLHPDLPYGPWTYEEETLNIANGIFPVVEYGSNFISPEEAEVFVSIDSKNGGMAIIEDREESPMFIDLPKAELQVNSEWATPRWTVRLDNAQLPGNYGDWPVRISYNDTLEIHFSAISNISSNIRRLRLNGWVERNGEKYKLTTEFRLEPGESLSDFTIFLFERYDQP